MKNPFKILDKEKLFLAFEYGLTVSEVAKKQGVELNRELIERCEKILFQEFRDNGPTHLAVEMIPNILAMFEPKFEAEIKEEE